MNCICELGCLLHLICSHVMFVNHTTKKCIYFPISGAIIIIATSILLRITHHMAGMWWPFLKWAYLSMSTGQCSGTAEMGCNRDHRLWINTGAEWWCSGSERWSTTERYWLILVNYIMAWPIFPQIITTSQILQCTGSISYNTPLWNGNVHIVMYFGIWDRCIVGFVRLVYRHTIAHQPG